MPGTDFRAALDVAFRLAPRVPFLPELPARGPHAGMIGRAAGMLIDLPAVLDGDSWRLAARPGRDTQRSKDLLAHDLDALTRFVGESVRETPQVFKVQVAGVWTLTAGLLLPRGDAVLGDPIAVRDLAQSLALGIVEHVRAVARCLAYDSTGRSRLIIQLDEPSLPGVLEGNIRRAGSISTLPAIAAAQATTIIRELVAELLSSLDDVLVVAHCCASSVPFDVLGSTGIAAIMADLRFIEAADTRVADSIAAALSNGTLVWPGIVSAVAPPLDKASRGEADDLSDVAATVARVRKFYADLGFSVPPGLVGETSAVPLVVSPSCGAAGADAARFERTMSYCGRVADALAHEWGVGS